MSSESTPTTSTASSEPSLQRKSVSLACGLFWVLLIVLVATRFPVVNDARSGFFFNVDEMDMTMGAADRFLGIPMANLHWPGTVNQVVVEGLLGMDYAGKSRLHPRLTGFMEYLAGVYRNGWHMLFLHRLAVAFGFSLGLAYLYRRLAGHMGNWVPLVGLMLFAFVPHVWIYSGLAAGNGLAIGFLCVATGVLLAREEAIGSWRNRVIVAGACAAFALACRNTMVPYLAFLMAMILQYAPTRRIRLLILFIIAFAFFLFLATPSLWMEPIRWIKANAGNYRKSGTPGGIGNAIRVFFEAVPWWFAVIGAISCIALVKRKLVWLVAGVAGTAAFMIFAAAGAPQVEPRYFHSCALAIGVVSAMGIAYGVMDLKANAGRMVLAVAAVVVVLTGVLGLWSVRRLEPEGPTRADGEAVSAFLEQQHGKHVAVSFDLYYHSLRFANADSVKEMADRCEERLWNGRSVENYLASYGFPPTMAAAFTRNFTEKEQAYVARGRLISAFPAGDVQLEYFANSAKDASVPRFGLKTVDEEFAAISDGKLDAVLILENDEWIGGPTGKSLGGRVYVVTRDSGPTGAATMKR